MNGTKQLLVDNIQTWINIDNEMKVLRRELKDRRDKKKQLTAILVDIMKQNQLDVVEMKNEKLLYTTTKIKTPLSKKHLYDSLTNFFKDDTNTAKKLAEYIMNSRTEKINENIKRKNIK